MTAVAGQDGSAGNARGGIGRVVERARPILADPANMLGAVLLFALICRAVWLWLPNEAQIFDEKYYVNAARAILGWTIPVGNPYADAPLGLDPNTEHPPLGKALIALSMAVFGDGGLGWRLPSLISAMAGLLAVYGIVRASGETARLGVLIVALFALDNLAMVHGRIGTLDMLFLAPILIGAWLAIRGDWALAGVAFGVGSLVKLTAVLGLGGIVLMQVVLIGAVWRRTGRIGRADVKPLAVLLVVFLVVFVGGLWLLDLRFTTFSGPLSHIEHMLSFGAGLQAPNGPTGIASEPWRWLVNEVQINYLRVAEDVRSGGEVVSSAASIDFRGAMNPVLIGAAALAFPFAIWSAWRTGSRLALWSVTWAAATYLPYYVLVLVGHRITYLYYVLPMVPALAVAVALLLRRSGLPRLVTWGYLAAIVAGFAAYFPFRQIP